MSVYRTEYRDPKTGKKRLEGVVVRLHVRWQAVPGFQKADSENSRSPVRRERTTPG